MGSNGWLSVLALCSLYASLARAASDQERLKWPQEARGYNTGDAIPVSCLNRTIETGEHIVDTNGHLQYIPFPSCAETNSPLSLSFASEKDINCTIPFITDEFFHLLEFYIHNDAPLTCRVPSSPAALAQYTVDDKHNVGALGAQSTTYTPLTISLAGTLQLSHLHVASALNLLLHTTAADSGVLAAAAAYSIAPPERAVKVAIGDPLTLQFSVRWYSGTGLPRGTGGGGSVWRTVVWCVVSAGVSVVGCVVWFRGVELPRRLREKVGGGRYGYGLPVPNGAVMGEGSGGYGGYGYGVGFGGSGSGLGKKD